VFCNRGGFTTPDTVCHHEDSFSVCMCLAPKAQHSSWAWGNAPGFAGSQRDERWKRDSLSARFDPSFAACPQSLSKVILHVIFSTRNREPWLDSDVRPRVHAYLATICRDLGAEFVRVGGVADHVHIVATLPRTLSQLNSSNR